MWICEKCNEENEDVFDECWKCFKGSDAEKIAMEQANLLEKERLKQQSIFRRGLIFVFFIVFAFFCPNRFNNQY
mgnify:CR=1 FL=1